MPSLNGVHVGDVWRNRHTKEERRILEIRLGGAGTYTDREPVVVFDEDSWMLPNTLWSLAEHWEPITRPKQWPVPWHYNKRFGKGGRSANAPWRCPGIRGGHRERRKYFHSYLRMDGEYSTTGWRWWQIDPEAEQLQQQIANVLAGAQELIESGDPLLVKVGKRALETFAEAA